MNSSKWNNPWYGTHPVIMSRPLSHIRAKLPKTVADKIMFHLLIFFNHVHNYMYMSGRPTKKISSFWWRLFPLFFNANQRHTRLHKSGKRSYPYVKMSFKTQHGRIPIDPAIVAAIGHRFTAKNWRIFFFKLKCDGQVWGDMRGDQKPDTFLALFIVFEWGWMRLMSRLKVGLWY